MNKQKMLKERGENVSSVESESNYQDEIEIKRQIMQEEKKRQLEEKKASQEYQNKQAKKKSIK
jgi:hypothetical protein